MADHTTPHRGQHSSAARSLDDPSDQDHTDLGRRHFLMTAVATTGVVGAGFTAVPFIGSLRPSAKAQAEGAAVNVNVNLLDPGEEITVIWRGRPVRVLRRTSVMLERLGDARWRQHLRDPDSAVVTQQPAYAQNPMRSIRPEYLVIVASCTHLGCVPLFEPVVPNPVFGADWLGGYYCPCHGSRFDFAGRVTKNVPAPTNLVVPPHRYLQSGVLEIGIDHVAA